MFFLRSLAEQVRRLEKKVDRERIVLAAMPELQLQIVEFARENGRVTIGEVMKLTGASRNKAQAAFPGAGRARHAKPTRQWPRGLVQPTLTGMAKDAWPP